VIWQKYFYSLTLRHFSVLHYSYITAAIKRDVTKKVTTAHKNVNDENVAVKDKIVTFKSRQSKFRMRKILLGEMIFFISSISRCSHCTLKNLNVEKLISGLKFSDT